MTSPVTDRLAETRREFHRHPEPAWREFSTTARLVEEIPAPLVALARRCRCED